MTAPASPSALRSRSFRSDRIAWIVSLALLAAAFAATKAWLHRRVFVGREMGPSTFDFRLPVLAYGRVTEVPRDGHFHARTIAEHFEALRAAGFQPVSLRQVHAAYTSGAPLPERSVLLTFDGGHLSTVQAVDPLLRKLDWQAAFFVDARLTERRDSTYVYWDRLQRMVDSGLWDVGSSGPESGPLLQGHLAAYEVLGEVDADPSRPLVRGTPHALVFENTPFGMNDRFTPDLRLARMQVSRAWSGRDLVERLEFLRSAPGATASGGPAPVPATRWVSSLGHVAAGAGEVTLSGSPFGEAWVAGSEWASDFELEAEVRPDGGPFWIVQQAGSREQWRWGGTEQTLFLERLRPGARARVMSRTDVPTPAGTWHSLRIVKRGELVRVEWDGVAGPPRSVATRARGHVGISTGSRGEPGRLTIRNARFAAGPFAIVGARP